MSVISVKELWEGRKAGHDAEHMRNYTRVFQVITDNANNASVLVGSAIGLPKLYSPYIDADGAVDRFALMTKIEPQQTEDPYVWHVVCTWETRLRQFPELARDNKDTGKPPDDPTQEPAKLNWSLAQFQQPVAFSIHGVPVTNSANERPDPPVEKDDSRLVLTISRNEYLYTPQTALDYKDAVNSDSFLGFKPLSVKVANIRASSAFKNNLFYYEVTYEFHIRQPIPDEITVSSATRTGTVAGATAAAPVLITSLFQHGLATGDVVTLSGYTSPAPGTLGGVKLQNQATGGVVGGSVTATLSTWLITVVDASSFTLNGSTGAGTYTSGGTWTSIKPVAASTIFGPWAKIELDQGFHYLDDNSKPQRIKDSFNADLSSPVPLDRLGHQLPQGATPVYMGFDVYPSKQFAPLNLP